MQQPASTSRLLLATIMALVLGLGMALANNSQNQSDKIGDGMVNSCDVTEGHSGDKSNAFDCEEEGPVTPDPDPEPCSDCENVDEASFEQQIDITVPTVVRLVLDHNYSDQQNMGLRESWTVDFEGAAGTDNCYVIPNWVGEREGMTTLRDFLEDAESLLAWDEAYGYPAVITNAAGDEVLDWADVADIDDAYTAGDRGDDPAKGNVICVNDLMVEAYTNCPGISFYVEMSNTSGGAFGDLYVWNERKYSGVDQAKVFGGGALFTAGSSTDRKHLGSVPQNHFYDNYVSQLLDLTYSEPGSHTVELTYTLGSAVTN